MSKKPVGGKRLQRQQEERTALHNILITFLVGLAAESYLFLVYRFPVALYDILLILGWVGLAAFVGGGVLALVKKNSEKLRKIGVLTSVLGLFFATTGWVVAKFFESGIVVLCVLVPVATILGLVYFLYQRECFLNTLVLSGTLFTLWVCDRGMDGNWRLYITIGVIAVAILLVAMCIAVGAMKKKDGKLGDLQVFSGDCDYRVIYAVAAVAVVLILVGMLMPSVIFYLIWAAVIALFAELVYYTVKMM